MAIDPISDFSGGLWIPGDPDTGVPEPGFAVPANALLQADNVDYLDSGAVRGRRGRVQRYTVPASVFGLWRHYPRRGVVHSTREPSVVTQGVGSPQWNLANVFQPEIVFNPGENGSPHLLFQGFTYHFQPPPTATIFGVQIDLGHQVVLTGIQDSIDVIAHIHVVDATGLPVGDETTLHFPVGVGSDVIGGPISLFGLALTPADIISPNFGFDVQIELQPAVPAGQVVLVKLFGSTGDPVRIRMTVYWFDAANPDPPSLIVATSPVGRTTYYATDASNTLQLLTAIQPQGHRPHFVSWPEQGATFIFDGVNPPLRYSHDPMAPNGRQLESFATPAGNVIADSAGNVQGVTVATPLGPYATLWQNRLWAITPSEADWSVYGCEVNNPYEWLSDAQLSINDPSGGTITGLVGMVGYPAPLVMLKDTALFYFLGDILVGGALVQYSQRGCVAPETVQLTPMGIIYLARDGVFLTDGQAAEPQELSAPLEALFRARTDDVQYPNAVGVWYGKGSQYWLKLDPAAVDGYVLTLRRVGGQLRISWAHMPVMPLNAGSSWPATVDAGQLVIGDDQGVIREADIGPTDDGQVYPVAIRTAARAVDGTSPLLREGRVCYVKPAYRGSKALTGELRYQADPTLVVPFTVGTDNGGPKYITPRATVTEQATFGRVVDVALQNATDGPEFELHRIALDTQLRTVRQWRP